MIESAYHFCPQCGKPLLIQKHHGIELQVCEAGHLLYKNQNACASGVIVKNGKMLLVRRAFKPQKGKLDLPGGFVEPDEHPQQAMVREISEELSLEVKTVKLLGVYGPDIYPYKGVTNYNLEITYQLDILSGTPKPQDDVASLEWFELNALPYGQMAFVGQNQFLEELRDKKVFLQL